MESAPPTVTVVIATYNRSGTLRCAIDSVLWQTFQDFELWVIGDACTDDSAEVVGSYTDPRVKWYNLPQNSGYQSAPTNEGLRRARGKYIAYVNHDDIWLPNHLQVLVEHVERTGADVVFTILEWVLTYADNYADIPDYPDAPLPPEASVTLHRRSLVDELGYWKPPQETYSVPRAEYFRRMQFAGKRFELVPMLTVLKFGGTSGGYSAVGQQPEYMSKVHSDPDFVHRELAAMLVRAYHELNRPITCKRLRYQLSQSLRRWLVKRRVDPARLVFWHKPGRHIRAWRRAHRLDG